MGTILIALMIIYFIVGLLVYLFTDTRNFSGKVEKTFVFLTFADINKHMFPFVVALWPIWLYINSRYND